MVFTSLVFAQLARALALRLASATCPSPKRSSGTTALAILALMETDKPLRARSTPGVPGLA